MSAADPNPAMTPKEGVPKTRASKLGKNLAVIGSSVLYMLPLFWLWTKTAYPESFGFRITAHGKTGLLENWWYSYLFIERHRPMDIAAFIYMWAPVMGCIAWLCCLFLKDHKLTLFTSDNEESRS